MSVSPSADRQARPTIWTTNDPRLIGRVGQLGDTCVYVDTVHQRAYFLVKQIETDIGWEAVPSVSHAARVVSGGVPAAPDTTSIHAAMSDALSRATLSLSSLTSTHMTTVVEAVALGAAGGVVSLALVADNLPAQKSTLDLATKTTNWNTKVRAVAAGAGGNAKTVALVVDGSQAVKASLDLATKTTHCNTVIQAKVAGAGGNSFRIASVADGAGVGSLTLSGSDYTFHYATGVTTVTNFETLITASANLAVKTPGTGANLFAVTVDAFSLTALAGGAAATAASVTDSAGVVTFHATDGITTVTNLEALFPTTSLEIKTAGTGANVIVAGDAFAATNLAGGAATQAATITEVGAAVTLHIVPSETTVATAETALNTSTQLSVKAAGTGGTVLISGDAFAAHFLSGGGSSLVTTGITNPDVPRNVRIAFGAGWDGGDITVSGIDQFGAPVAETIVNNPGATVVGAKIFASIASLRLGAAGVANATASVGLGSLIGLPVSISDTVGVLYVDNVIEAVTLDATVMAFTPTTAPNASHAYKLIVNV